MAGATKTATRTATKTPRRLLLFGVPAVLVIAVVVVVLAKWLTTLPSVEAFVEAFPGHSELPEAAPVGLPAWLGWQHALNAFLLILIIRSGWQVRRTTRPAAYWTRRVGVGRSARKPKRISLELWFHLSLDVLWVLNGIVFVILLAATGQWMRIVPTSWDIVPNAASAALQYASLDWPVESGWVNYNALQVLAYFTTVFIAAPLALVTGLRMSPLWPAGATRVNRVYPVEWARSLHFPVMLYFVGFVVVHVALVLLTGARRNLNHMYAASDADDWTGVWIFAGSVVVMVAAWLLARPVLLRPLAALTGTISR
jgi:thiosulfate reductase cytochrome b subunit